MNIWEQQDELLKSGIESERQAAKRIAQESIVSIKNNSSAYQKDAKINGECKELLAVRMKPKEIRITLFQGDEIASGDIIECFGEQWIVVECFEDENENRFATAWICNHTFRWQNGTSQVIEQAGVLDDGAYSSRSNQQIPLEEGHYRVYLPLDSDTEKIFIDKRFAIGKIYDSRLKEILSVVKTVWADKQSGNLSSGDHLLKLRMNNDLYNPERDNISEMVCDYIKFEETDSPEGGELAEESESGNVEEPTVAQATKCVIAGSSNIRVGTKRTYTVKALDAYGDEAKPENENVDFDWDYDAADNISFSDDGDQLLVDVPLNLKLIGAIIRLRASVRGENSAKCEFAIEIVG